MWKQVACDALAQGKCLQLTYDRFSRVVEVHCVGRSAEGHDLMRVWQVRGGSKSGENVGWKLLHLDEALGAVVIDEDSQAPRPGYNRNDTAMTTQFCRL